MLKTYYHLTKPGIIRGNVITAAAGFLFAAKGDINLQTFLAVLVGTSLVIACGCVLNNYIDRDIDKKMTRTKTRALVTGVVSTQSAFIYASILGLAGFLILAMFTNLLTVFIGFVGLFFYVVVYAIAKRKTVYGTIIGTIPGATPIVAGYTAANGAFDFAGFLLFACLVLWQLPHFYAIAMYRLKEYVLAELPVLPAVKGMKHTKVHIFVFIVAFTFASLSLTGFGYTGSAYLIVMATLCLLWLRLAIKGFETSNDEAWARKVFGLSLIVLLGFSIMLSVNVVLP